MLWLGNKSWQGSTVWQPVGLDAKNEWSVTMAVAGCQGTEVFGNAFQKTTLTPANP
jgi:hypothetical protein